MRDEGKVPAEAASAEDAAAPPHAFTAQFTFTGDGAEYFRIWIFNTLLSLLTFGVYSAWAKIRKASYFSRNTQLLGHSFDFNANPWAILRGRLIALVLFVFYGFGSDFSIGLGIASVLLLLALGPWLIRSANRFKLHNSKWRGLPFAFTASERESYVGVFPVVAVWLGAAVVGSFFEFGTREFLAATVLQLVLLPWMHHRFKKFQHAHVRFGDLSSSFKSALGAFYLTYGISWVVLIGVTFGMVGLVGPVMNLAGEDLYLWAMGVLVGASVYLVIWPYFAARIQAAVWNNTTLGPLRFKTRIALRTLWPIAARNGILLALTAGLYWPFASIAWARYRIECMSLESDVQLEALADDIQPAASQATGEGALDIFGIDLGF